MDSGDKTYVCVMALVIFGYLAWNVVKVWAKTHGVDLQ